MLKTLLILYLIFPDTQLLIWPDIGVEEYRIYCLDDFSVTEVKGTSYFIDCDNPVIVAIGTNDGRIINPIKIRR